MKFLIQLIAIGPLLLPPLAASQDKGCSVATHAEVFLLAPKLHYIYDYYRASSSFDEIYSSSWVDSGFVEYLITDSLAVNDSTVTWHVTQYQSLLHHQMSSLAPFDTSYWTSDTSTITLFEYTSGFHEIRCDGSAWRFPLYPDAYPVYRFADSSEVIKLRNWDLSVYSTSQQGSDTLYLSHESGLSLWRSSERFHNPITTSYGRMTIALREAPTSVSAEPVVLPPGLVVRQNYPNPFNPATTIDYFLPDASPVTLYIFNSTGQLVEKLSYAVQSPGQHAVLFNAGGLASGSYFYQIQAGKEVRSKKFIIVK